MKRKKILIHIANNKGGGGAVVARQVIQSINNQTREKYLINIFKNHNFKVKDKKNINKIISVPNNSTIDSFFINRYKLPLLIKKGDYDLLLNMCNFPIKTNIKQLIYFQNPNRLWEIRKQEFIPKLIYRFRNYEYWKKITKEMYFAFQTNVIKNKFLLQYEKVWKQKFLDKHIFLLPSINFWDHSSLPMYKYRNSNYFCYISKYYVHKNFEILPKALTLLPKKYKIILTIDKSDSTKFYNLCRKLNVEKRIVFIGQIPHKKVFEIMANSIAVLMPTKLETYGFPYYEAMQVGTPIIASDTIFSKDACGNAAFYYHPNNYNELAEKMRLLINNVNKGYELSQKSKEQFEKKKVSIDDFTTRLFNIFNKILYS